MPDTYWREAREHRRRKALLWWYCWRCGKSNPPGETVCSKCKAENGTRGEE